MATRNRLKDPNVMMMRIGLVCLVLFEISTYFVHPPASFPNSAADGLKDFLLGASIGLLFLSIRQRSAKGSAPCA